MGDVKTWEVKIVGGPTFNVVAESKLVHESGALVLFSGVLIVAKFPAGIWASCVRAGG